MIISICIPTYHRSKNLDNCLNSINLNKFNNKNFFEICISDNSTDDMSSDVVSRYKKVLPINYIKNQTNIGRVKNYLNVVSMAKGDFVWLLGDDDLLVPNAINNIKKLIENHASNVDFFYINSFILKSKYVFSQKQPFNTKNLPLNMKKFAKKNNSLELNFIDLINPKISFDFLGGMYLAVFKKNKWDSNIKYLNKSAIEDHLIFSHYDNTFPHVKIFAKAFKNSRAYYMHTPLSVTLSGEREWAPMYSLVRSIRLIESLDIFKENGLSNFKYISYKNYALRYFMQDMIKILLDKKNSGLEHVSFKKHILTNILYPNLYLSVIYFFIRRIKRIFINKHDD